jgi:hypothetical protein
MLRYFYHNENICIDFWAFLRHNSVIKINVKLAFTHLPINAEVFMDLISKSMVIKLLNERREHYRSDTDVGKNIREGVEKCIHDIEDAYTSHIFSLKHMGQSDLTALSDQIKEKLEELNAEPEIKVFCIKGFYELRYTRCHEKAKDILKEEFDLMLEQVDVDYADSKIDIQTMDIKQSNLKDYKIE